MTFTKEQLQHIIETDHVQCGEASALARIALASLEAVPVAYMNRFTGRVFTLEEQPGADTDAQVYMPVYTTPPAPVSVPECFKRLLHHAYGMTMGHDWNKGTMAGHHRDKLCRAVEDCRATMLKSFGNSEQLNSPVIPDGWVACSERMPEQFKAILAFNEYGEVWSGAYDRYWNFYCDNLLVEHVTHWMPLPAAPQQEVR